MRPLRFLLTLLTCVSAFFCLLFFGPWRATTTEDLEERTTIGALFNWRAPSSLFPPSAIISLTDDNSTFFLARPAAFGPLLPSKSLSGQLWIGSGFGDDHLGRGGAGGGAEGELGCSDIPDWDDDGYRSNNGKGRLGNAKTAVVDLPDGSGKRKRGVEMEVAADEAEQGEDPTEDDGTDDHLHHPLPPSDGLKTNGEPAGNVKKPTHADIQSLQETAEIAGKVVLLSRGGCGFLEKVKWVQRRGGVALIVGDDLRGGPLVTMYAHGDTSNVTIPALFTSHMTAHLLSSLIPSGSLAEELSAEEAARLGLVFGDKASAVKGSKKSAVAERPNFTTTTAAAKATTASKVAQSKAKVAVDEDEEEELSREAAGWLRSIFSRRGSAGRSDSRRPPSSGNLDWVQQHEFEDANDEHGVIGRKAGAPLSRVPSTKKGSSTGKGDGFVIGIQDWRDPDMVADEKERQQASTSSATSTSSAAAQSSASPKHAGMHGGSITPGSGEYAKANHEVAALSGSHKQASTAARSGKHSKAHDVKSGNWFSRFFHLEAERERSQATPEMASKASEPDSQPSHPDGAHANHKSTDDPPQHDGLWVTLTPTAVSSSPFFDTLLVLVVSPLVTLTVVYALLLLRSRIRRRRWRAPKSVVQRLPVRTYHTMSSSATSASTPEVSSPVSATTPLLPSSPRPINARVRPRSRTASEVPVQASSSLTESLAPPSLEQIEEKRAAGLAEWRRRTPWLTTRRRTCPICKGDVVRSLARLNTGNNNNNNATTSTSPPLPPSSLPPSQYHDDPTEETLEEQVQEQAATTRNDDPAAALPVSREDEAFEDLERGIGGERSL
ncbi:hypothetical protein LTR91_004015 [Friedmanniomyces endolithicus]|uniref:PA domain-containing protein n=1 Tax=Friedmanniomyces endolithicus TaxID=329885 RepID=A0AAN6FGV3_9PEZI|nr:hypothetical protein LTR35_010412 [Friedmanniomyces endolithicus]KAK0294214.1 hypothetical protein LTS00_007189 [Friedmanniomyces endolithicus]KAK0303044.1 hypothetical protein LTR01_008336 [Friedmanniomyces endolithicus]KAK0315166.1 hypothetical protein LTR82_012725 [Friedmanniomyces endolithicus]KAK0825263.1 hypothetical protein LTR73_007218 [Friedmanniomyces endolithicus]